jgi:A/G-specific adenine glycosylase
MLQQTRVETVIPYYERFLREFPSVQALAEAPADRVLAAWSGLGYYRRARMLHAAAKTVSREHAGRLPPNAEGLRALEGIGAYTAGAVASIAFGERAALVDGNVARVLSRLFAIREDVKTGAGARRVWGVAERLVAAVDGDPGDWNQALMELGATVCLPGERARCGECPVASACAARAQGIVAELPRVPPRREPTLAARVAIVLASDTHVVLARRRGGTGTGAASGGLFAGLWEPPSADEGARDALCEALRVEPAALEARGVVEHVLSHRRMRIAVYRGDVPRRRLALPGVDYDAIEAVPVAELAARGHARVTRKVLARAGALGVS